jgi:1,4-dihydroxy-2-naphthoyl-CoA hydrolase
MRAIQAAERGGYEALRLVDIPQPQRQSGHAQVRVTSAGVTPLDRTVLAGLHPRAKKSPLVPGNEGAGVVIDELTGSRVTGHIDLGPEHHTPWGIVNGGVYCTVIEATASIGASAAVQDRDKFAVGLTNTTRFLRPLTSGTVTVDAVALNQGRTQQLWRVDITDTTGRLIAHGEVRLQNVDAARANPGTPG